MIELLGKRIKSGGSIYSLTLASDYEKNLTTSGISPNVFIPWDLSWIGWRDGVVCTVKYDEPQKQLTFEEYREHFPYKELSVLQEEYDELPRVSYAVMPLIAIKDQIDEPAVD